MTVSPRTDAPRRYVMLMTSLPHLGDPFRRDRTPMSRTRLDRRLSLLDPVDAETLAAIEKIVQWEAVEQDSDDDALLDEAERLEMALTGAGLDDLAEALAHRLKLRAVVAALRWRKLGHDGPGDAAWATMVPKLADRWQEPDFGLTHRFPWVLDASRLIEQDDALGMERLLLATAWADLADRARRHPFDFTGLVLYVLRWDITDRWTRMSAQKAQERFDRLWQASFAGLDPLLAGQRAHG